MEHYKLCFQSEDIYKNLSESNSNNLDDEIHHYAHIYKDFENGDQYIVGIIYVDIDWNRNKAYVSVYDVTEEGQSELDSQIISFYDYDSDKEIEKTILNVCEKYFTEIQEQGFSIFVREKLEDKVNKTAKRYNLEILSDRQAKELDKQGKDYQILNINTSSVASPENIIVKLNATQYHQIEDLKLALLAESGNFSNIQIFDNHKTKINENNDYEENTTKRRRR